MKTIRERTHCLRGHELTEDNIYLPKDGRRRCATCSRMRRVKYYAATRIANEQRREEQRALFSVQISEVELSWTAGLFEGEGTVTIVKGGRRAGGSYTHLVVTMTNTDLEIVEFFRERWAAPLHVVRRPPTMPNARDAYEWRLSSARASVFLSDILPYVRTSRMRDRIAIALESQAARVQGQRVDLEGYRAMHEEFRRRIQELNRKGRPPEGKIIELGTGTGR